MEGEARRQDAQTVGARVDYGRRPGVLGVGEGAARRGCPSCVHYQSSNKRREEARRPAWTPVAGAWQQDEVGKGNGDARTSLRGRVCGCPGVVIAGREGLSLRRRPRRRRLKDWPHALGVRASPLCRASHRYL